MSVVSLMGGGGIPSGAQARVTDSQQVDAWGGSPIVAAAIAPGGSPAPGAAFSWAAALVTLVVIRILWEVAND